MSNLSDATDANPLTPNLGNSNPRAAPFQSDWNYEQTVKKIEATIAQIESGELELTEVLDQFALAVKKLRECEIFLNQHQERMDLLIETLSDEPD